MSTTTKEKITLNLKKPHSKTITEALGISEKRSEELCELILSQWGEEKETTAEAMKKIADGCETHEELAWSMFTFGCHVSEGAENPIASLMRALGEKN
jgi:hypothetical protein